MSTINIARKEKPLYRTIGHPRLGIEFAIGGLAGMGTAFLTNPADLLKTRLQLQGELEAPGSGRRAYAGSWEAARLVARREGLLALQSGLGPALGLQLLVNGARLGSYHLAKRLSLTVDERGRTNVLRTAALSGTAGSLAFVVGSPLYLDAKYTYTGSIFRLQNLFTWAILYLFKAKIKLQTGEFSSTRAILIYLWQQGGFRNLYRGWNANIPRLFVGSAVQLTAFGLITDWLNSFQELSKRPLLLTFLASLVSGAFLVASIQPLDVMATRLYNQKTDKLGKGLLYNGMYDSISKIVRTEGFFGLYKGVFPNWLRLAPYVVIGQVLYQKIALIYDDLYT